MDQLAETEDMTLFQAQAITDMILYKWESYSKKFHTFGLLMNLFFTAMVILFVFEIYINGNEDNKILYLTLLIIANIYPVAYECL